MGQRVVSGTTARSSQPVSTLYVATFSTPFGWWGILGAGETLFGLTLGNESRSQARCAIGAKFDPDTIGSREFDWFPDLRARLERYSTGEAVEFDDIDLHLPRMTAFQWQVVQCTRALRHGQTMTYSELAERAGAPRAARAVGNIMSTNRIPIVIPCHRVVGAGGRLGGYSAPQGVSLKQRLLQLESGLE